MPRKKNTRSAAGSGTIRQRANGTWEGRYTVGHDPMTGKQVQRSVYGKTQKEVRQKLSKIAASIDEGTFIVPSKATLGEWLLTWHADYLADVKESTRHIYEARIKNRINPAIGRIKLCDLNTTMLQSFYNSLQKSAENPDGLSPRSVRLVHALLHNALDRAVKLGYISSNPSENCVLPRTEQNEVHFISGSELHILLNELDKAKHGNLFKFHIFTGLRQGEAIGLTWDCVDFENGTITVKQQLKKHKYGDKSYYLGSTKNGRARTIKPAKYVMDLLSEQRRKQDESAASLGDKWHNDMNLVFTGDFGKNLAHITVYKAFQKIVKELGLEDIRYHDMRHTYAVISLENGDDIKTLQNNIGHASAAFTLDVYGHVSDRMLEDSSNHMQAFIDGIQRNNP